MSDEKSGQNTLVTETEQFAPISPSTTTTSAAGATLEKKATINLQFNSHSAATTPAETAGNPFERDLEGGCAGKSDNDLRLHTKADRTSRHNPNCTVWPGQDHWRKQAKAHRNKNRYCTFMSNYGRRTRIVMKIAIVLLIVAIGCAVGFGVSKPLGAGIWKPKDGTDVNN